MPKSLCFYPSSWGPHASPELLPTAWSITQSSDSCRAPSFLSVFLQASLQTMALQPLWRRWWGWITRQGHALVLSAEGWLSICAARCEAAVMQHDPSHYSTHWAPAGPHLTFSCRGAHCLWGRKRGPAWTKGGFTCSPSIPMAPAPSPWCCFIQCCWLVGPSASCLSF